MTQATRERTSHLLVTTPSPSKGERLPAEAALERGFGGNRAPSRRPRKTSTRRRAALGKADRGPLGKHPDLDAIIARQRLHLPLSGRITTAQVNQAWKQCAAEHHPDRGGTHTTMQLVNGARDLLLGRTLG